MKKTTIVLFVLLLASVTLCLRTTLGSTVGIAWTKYSGNPLNLPGVWHVVYPWVIYDGQTFKMWYTGMTSPSSENRIYYADSPDGINWTTHGVVLEKGEPGSWDDMNIAPAAVLFNGTTYKMWYVGVGSSASVWGMVGYATSSDGVSWTKYKANPVLVPGGNGGWDDWNIGDMSVIFNGTHYMMWYSGQAVEDGIFKTGVATSVDGISWTKYHNNPVLVPEPSAWDNTHVFTGPVIYNGSCYEMWYTGIGPGPSFTGRIGLATSPDGFSWSKYAGNPVLEPGSPGSWDSDGINCGSVVKKGSTLLMWYWGHPQPTKVGLAISFTRTIEADVDFCPDSLNLRSNGKWITGYIELPESYDVTNINVSSILLNGTIPVALSSPSQIADCDGDGVLELMVKFDRAAVQSYILSHAVFKDRFAEATLTLTGKLNTGIEFEGNDTMRIILN